MAVAYKRKYSLFIGRPRRLNEKVTNGGVTVQAGGDNTLNTVVDANYNTEPPSLKGVRFTEHQITAKISSSKGDSNTNPAKIEIFQAANESIKVINLLDTVLLRAGYEGSEPPLIFAGQVAKIETERRGPDIVTTLTCSGS